MTTRLRCIRACLAVLLLATAAGAATAQSLRPEPGLWYNPERSGHGVDFQFAGNTLVGIWYTYDDSGRPTWYIASAAYTGVDWSAPLMRATWNGSAATLVPVGTLGLRVREDDRADFSWNLGGNTGSEPFERLRYGSGPPVADLTGIYHHAAQTGWGLSFEVQGNTAAAVLYFYDASGFPRWALGTAPVTGNGPDKAGASVPMSAFTSGFSANSPYIGAPRAVPVGTLGLDSGRLTVDVLLPGGLGGWQRDVPASRLTDSGPAYLFAHIQGPTIIPAGASAPYSARFDTNIADLSALQFEWSVLYGERVVQSTASSVNVQPQGSEGLVALQLEVTHPPTGRSAFATLSVSAQLADLFDVAIVSGRPEVLVGRNHRFDAVVVGGRPPYSYDWVGDFLSIDGVASTFVDPPCHVAGTSSISVIVRDADNRAAQARFDFSYATAMCFLSIDGPPCLQPGTTGQFAALTNGLPEVVAGRSYAWSSSLLGPLPACSVQNGVYCQITGPAGVVSDLYTLRVDHPTLGSAQRAVARGCGGGLELELLASREFIPDVGGDVEISLNAVGGVGPYSFRVLCGLGGPLLELPAGGATRSVRCNVPATRDPYVALVGQVQDSALQARNEFLHLPVGPGVPSLSLTLDAPSAPGTCAPADFALTIANGTPPFDLSVDWGDGSQHSERSSSRNHTLQHEYAPASGGTARNLRVVVIDSTGTRGELTRSLTPANTAVDVTVTLRNGASQNIHIYDRATPAGGWFDIGTRLTPGATRNERISIPASVCETTVDWGAGRNATPLTARSCSYRKRQPAASVTYSESGGPALGCG